MMSATYHQMVPKKKEGERKRKREGTVNVANVNSQKIYMKEMRMLPVLLF